MPQVDAKTVETNFMELLDKSFESETKTPLKDVPGVSLKRKPPEKSLSGIREKEKHFSVVYIVVYTGELTVRGNIRQIPILIKIRFFYQEEEDYYPPEQRTLLFAPIDVISRDDYYWDVTKKQVLDSKGEETTLEMAVNSLFKKHIEPGLIIRLKILWYKILLLKLSEYISNFFDWVLFVLYGMGHKNPSITKRLIEKHSQTLLGVSRSPQQGVNPPKQVSFLGYKISKWALASYCFLVLLTHTVFFYAKLHSKYISSIFSNPFLVTIFALFLLTIYDLIIPKILKGVVDKTTNLYWNLSYKEIPI